MQRVALGRALVREPKIFLMDEPLSNLDAKLRTEMRVEIKKLQKKVGVTTLYITHDQAEAMSMADHVGIMNSGKMLQLDSPQKVYNEPANQFVASFMGVPPMNFLECSWSDRPPRFSLYLPVATKVQCIVTLCSRFRIRFQTDSVISRNKQLSLE